MYPTIFGFIDSYTLFLILGIVAAGVIFELYMRKKIRVPSSKLFYLEFSLLIAIALGIVGAYLFQNLYNFIESPSSYVWTWQLTFYGGLIFGSAAFFLVFGLWGRRHYEDGLAEVLRIGPASITAAHALGRIGCFLEGCCYGLPTEAWYGIKFVTTDTKVIPTNLFEAIFLFALCAIVAILAFMKRCDYAMPIYLIAYGAWRFAIEFARNDHRGSFVPGISPSQFWAIILFVLGVGYLMAVFFLYRKKKIEVAS